MKRLPTLCFLLLLLPGISFAQRKDFSQDSAFFHKKTTNYQRWLEKTGLGKIIKTDFFRLKDSYTELELHLLMETNSVDTAIAQWNQLEVDFMKNHGKSIQEELFNRFVHMMEIPPEQGNVQVYVKQANGEYIPCFYVWVWREKGELITDKKFGDCKAMDFEVLVESTRTENIVDGESITTSKNLTATETFDFIEAYARERFEPERCDERFPKVVQEARTSSKLTFYIEDLCQEVLKDEGTSPWCWIKESLGIDCNDMRRERLTFTFRYDETDNGFKLECELDGKFGSGVYRPRKSGYMDMEPDFEDYLEEYVLLFTNDLTRALQTYQRP
ncbi:MAG: hypothetical protein ACI9LN_003587 [Saprospiraceae bacterium]|jgi:hypothetical protein